VKATIKSSTFSSIYTYEGGVLYLADASSLIMESCSIDSVGASLGGGTMFIKNGGNYDVSSSVDVWSTTINNSSSSY